jgi:hypothetical protein
VFTPDLLEPIEGDVEEPEVDADALAREEEDEADGDREEEEVPADDAGPSVMPASPNPMRECSDDNAEEVEEPAPAVRPAPTVRTALVVQPAPVEAGSESRTKANADRPSALVKMKRSAARGKCPAPSSPPSAVPPAKKQRPKVPEVEA